MVAVLRPVNVYPVLAVSVTRAVYWVAPWNGLCAGDHATSPIVKLPVPVAVAFGAAPCTGAVTVIAAVVIGVAPVAWNWCDSVTVVPVLFVTVAPCPLIVAMLNPINVCPKFAVSVTVAVYWVAPWNGLWAGVHVTALTVKLPVPVAVVFGIAPCSGAVTVITAASIGAAPVSGNSYDSVTAAPVLLVITALWLFIVAVLMSVKVYPELAVSVTVAVYWVAPWNGLCAGVHVTAPIVKLPVPVAAGFGVVPCAGAVTVIAAAMIGVAPVAGNWCDNVTVVPVLFVTVALCPFIVAVLRSVKV